MKTFGLTGNIGCGKTTVAALLSKYPDVAVYDCDQIAKNIITDERHAQAIKKILGPKIFRPCGISFKMIADIIFSNPQKKAEFEGLIHPLVLKKVEEEIAGSKAEIHIVETALLYEVGWEKRFSGVIVASCDNEEQVRRLKEIRAMKDVDIRARIAQQLPAAEKINRAQFVIDTNCSMKELAARADVVYNAMRKDDMKKTAVYAGTFDPPTLGHAWMIKKASRLFDTVIVAIGLNPDKKTMFTLDERLEMLKGMAAKFPNVTVTSYENDFLITYVVSQHAEFILRGIRNEEDFGYEKAMRNINEDIGGDEITTVLLIPPRELVEISSSFVKGLVGPKGWERLVSKYVPEGVLKKLMASKHTLWRNLVARGARGDQHAFWNECISPYMNVDRAYHNWQHIIDMLREFYKNKHLTKDPVAVEMAIWFHDIVYETKPSDTGDHKAASNEERSAYKAQQVIKKLGLPASFGNRVAKLIMATKHDHVPTDPDTQFLVDLDLAILGKPEKEFDEYEVGIRSEYSWVPEEQFAKVRSGILQSFLDRPSIYSTEPFRTLYENSARRNLERSIGKLRK